MKITRDQLAVHLRAACYMHHQRKSSATDTETHEALRIEAAELLEAVESGAPIRITTPSRSPT